MARLTSGSRSSSGISAGGAVEPRAPGAGARGAAAPGVAVPGVRSARSGSAWGGGARCSSARHIDERRLLIALELNIGRDAAMIDRDARWCVIKRRGELDATIAGQRHHRLYRALAESRTSHQCCAVIVLERSGDDLRGRCGAAVHQDDDGRTVEIIARRRAHFEFRFRRAALGAHDHAAVEKRVATLRPPPRGHRRDCCANRAPAP